MESRIGREPDQTNHHLRNRKVSQISTSSKKITDPEEFERVLPNH